MFVLSLATVAILFCGCERAVNALDTAPGKSPGAPARRVYNLAGDETNPFEKTDSKALVFLFVRTDCPISNRYAPEINRLQARFAPLKIHFCLVYPDSTTTTDDVKRHMAEYGYTFDALRDPEHALVKLSGATTTPEAAVFAPDGKLLYRGRINDRFPELGAARAAATEHDLEEALLAFLSDKPIPSRFTRAVGCPISGLR